MNHLIVTLQKLYQVKVNWAGNKYLGMDINVDKTDRHVTISMPGYLAKLLQRVKPNGIKGASTPGTYTPPNDANPTSQRATVDQSKRVSEPQKRFIQSVVWTLLYYSNNAIRHYASDMILQIMSDASFFLSRPKARSVAGFSSYFGKPHTVSGPVAYASKIINSVVASVAEAELAAAFLAA
jgi:hypothetical protein